MNKTTGSMFVKRNMNVVICSDCGRKMSEYVYLTYHDCSEGELYLDSRSELEFLEEKKE